MLTRADALRILRASEHDLRARGVLRAAVFGSVARGDATDSSDLDIMIELDSATCLTMFDYAGLKRRIAGLFPCRTDVVDVAALTSGISTAAQRDAVYAF